MSYSIDVNGNDNTPEWGYCTIEGCEEEAFPIWTSGEYPDDPDVCLCPTHIGARLFELDAQRADANTALALTSYELSEAQADAAIKLQALDCLLLFVERGTFLSDSDRAFILSARQPGAGASILAELDAARAVIANELPAARIANRIMRQALDQIDTHRVGAYTTEEGAGANVEPCDECGEMRDIASEALTKVKAGERPAPTSNPDYAPTPDSPF